MVSNQNCVKIIFLMQKRFLLHHKYMKRDTVHISDTPKAPNRSLVNPASTVIATIRFARKLVCLFGTDSSISCCPT